VSEVLLLQAIRVAAPNKAAAKVLVFIIRSYSGLKIPEMFQICAYEN
jgi:hypothetical protein